MSEETGDRKILAIAARAQKVKSYLDDGIWNEDVDALGKKKRFGIQFLRFMAKTLNGFLSHRCGLHAAGLTYWSLLAVVPALCLLLSCAQICGLGDLAHKQIDGYIDSAITSIEKGQDEAPECLSFLLKGETPEEQSAKRKSARELAVKARQISDGLFEKIDQFKVGTLGIVGTLMLLSTVVSMFFQVEVAFNEIWEVPKPRSILRRTVLCVFVALVVPLFVFLALSMPTLRMVKDVFDVTLGATSYTKWAGDIIIGLLDSSLLRFAFTLMFASLGYAFVMWLMPNRKVSFMTAWKGGVVTAILTGAWMRFCVLAQVGVARWGAIYGSFAFLPIVLAWIYTSWQIVLLGGSMTYAFECVRRRMRDFPVD